MSILEKNNVLSSLLNEHMDNLILKERLSSEVIQSGITSGTMVLLGNIK